VGDVCERLTVNGNFLEGLEERGLTVNVNTIFALSDSEWERKEIGRPETA